MVDQRHVGMVGADFLQQRLDELIQVVDLLQFAAAVLVQLAVARQDVQLFEQLDRLTGPDIGNSAHENVRMQGRVGALHE